MEYIQVMASIYVSKILKDTFFCVCRNLTDYSLYIDTFALKFPKYNHLFFCSAQLTQPLKNVKVVRSPCPDPIHELHPQNKSGIGADVAKVSLEF